MGTFNDFKTGQGAGIRDMERGIAFQPLRFFYSNKMEISISLYSGIMKNRMRCDRR